MDRQVVVTAFFAIFCLAGHLAKSDDGSILARPKAKCPVEDVTCQKDKEGFEAIIQLHAQIDDNNDGGLNFAESNQFVKNDRNERIHAEQDFPDSDNFMTVHDLWRLWITSNVYNWTVDDIINWLAIDVELPQYEENFRKNSVTGHMLPRLSLKSESYATTLGIKNPVHKQRLVIKASDLVLFGLPKRSYLKDVLVALSFLVGAGGFYYAICQRSEAQKLLQKVNKDLSDLQNAEDALFQVQSDLEMARKEQQSIADDKQNLEKRLQDEIKLAKAEAERLKLDRDSFDSSDSSERKITEEELVQMRLTLLNEQRRLQELHSFPMTELQQWLQLCYEIETKYFETKKEVTEKELRSAKEMIEKLRKNKNKFLGSIRVAHTTSLDETDQKIMNVRSALEDIKFELQERTQRWQQIENICHFNIISNPGIAHLEAQLKRAEKIPGRGHLSHMALDDADESMPSLLLTQAIHQSSMSDLSFRGSSSLASGSPNLAHKVGHSMPTVPAGSNLKSKKSKPQLFDSGLSMESLFDRDHRPMMTATTTAATTISHTII